MDDFIGRLKVTEKTLKRPLSDDEFAYLALCNGFSLEYVEKVSGVKMNEPKQISDNCPECSSFFVLVTSLSGRDEEYVCQKCGYVSD